MANVNMHTQQIEYAGVDGNSRALYDADYTQFQPRFGFAYQAMQRLVVRGGYGISSYLEGTGANLRLTQNPPFHTDFEETGISPNPTATGGYSPGVFYQASNGFPTTQVPTTTFYVWPKNLKPAMTQEFSLTTEYQLAHSSTFQVGYVGILGHHLTDPYWGNQRTAPGCPRRTPASLARAASSKSRRPSRPATTTRCRLFSGSTSAAGFELTANYTYSKSLTDDIGFYGVSNIYSGQYYQQNAYDCNRSGVRPEWTRATTSPSPASTICPSAADASSGQLELLRQRAASADGN